jgi:hypothetical protein
MAQNAYGYRGCTSINPTCLSFRVCYVYDNLVKKFNVKGFTLKVTQNELQLPYFSVDNAHPKLFRIPYDV